MLRIFEIINYQFFFEIIRLHISKLKIGNYENFDIYI
jgi:hypothetical protein